MQETEAAWIAQAKQGDDDAFANLVETYQRPVYNLCYRMLGNAEEAEDAAQETFLRAYRSLKRYDPKRSFATWLLSIASHYCIDQHRKRRLKTLAFEDLPYQELPDPSPNAESSLMKEERQENVRDMLQSLNQKDRAAVVLRYWYDYSYQEIAESLSLTVSAVKSRLHRTRRELAHLWIDQQAQVVPVERSHHGTPAY